MAINESKATEILKTRGQLEANSLCQVPGGFGALVKTTTGLKFITVCAADSIFSTAGAGGNIEKAEENNIVELPLNANNAALVRRYVKGAGPTACGAGGLSVGLNDRLGIGMAPLLKLFAGRHMKPVLVETTPAECAALHANLLVPIDTATWSVIGAGFKTGYGACAAKISDEQDFLKTLLYMYSSIGFDCAYWLKGEVANLPEAELDKKYLELPDEFRKALEASYLNAEFKVGNFKLSFTKPELEKIVLEYGEAIMHIQTVYNTYFLDTPWPLDFELNLSKAGIALTPAAHYLIANEMQRNGIKQSAICLDALIDKNALENDFAMHVAIANTFGYRLSIASADLGLQDLGALSKKAGGKIHFNLNNLLWLAALQTIQANDAELMAKVAEKAGLAVPKAEELELGTKTSIAYAEAYAKIMATDKDGKALPLKESVCAHEDAYMATATAILDRFLKTII
jgi:hypothetical protein